MTFQGKEKNSMAVTGKIFLLDEPSYFDQGNQSSSNIFHALVIKEKHSHLKINLNSHHQVTNRTHIGIPAGKTQDKKSRYHNQIQIMFLK